MKVFELHKVEPHYRVIPTKLNNLKETDYIKGFGINEYLYREILKAKGLSFGTYSERYDNREGYYIDGTKINTRIHSLHSKLLIDIKSGKKYEIDTVSYLNYFGKYVTLMVREVGSLSHKEVLWENISCHYPLFISDIEKNQKKYNLIDK